MEHITNIESFPLELKFLVEKGAGAGAGIWRERELVLVFSLLGGDSF